MINLQSYRLAVAPLMCLQLWRYINWPHYIIFNQKLLTFSERLCVSYVTQHVLCTLLRGSNDHPQPVWYEQNNRLPSITYTFGFNVYLTSLTCRYNCNRFDEDDAKKARDAQEVCYPNLLNRRSTSDRHLFTTSADIGLKECIASFCLVLSWEIITFTVAYRSRGLHCNVISSTLIATPITCKVSSLNTRSTYIIILLFKV